MPPLRPTTLVEHVVNVLSRGLSMWVAGALFVAASALVSADVSRAQPAPLHRAHAHNDYEHERPLLDALDRGFTSIEVDVHEKDGVLLVGHDAVDLTPERTIETLYLKPLDARAAAQNGLLFADVTPLQLLVDFKTEADVTYRSLERVLAGYRHLLTRFENGVLHPGLVTVVVSGNRPRETMQAQSVRYAFYDGRLDDLEASPLASFMPLVSASWQTVAPFAGGSLPPPSVRRRIRDIVKQAHQQGKKVRFWATPEDEALWVFLYRAGVDYINTDRLAELEAFLRSR
jgi:glycerophosphoryl diester phosphodiesterase